MPSFQYFPSKYCIHTCLQMHYDSLQHSAWTSWLTESTLFQEIRAVSFSWVGLANFTRCNIRSSVLATVRSWIASFVFLGRRCPNSWFICASVSRQFSLKCHSGNSSFHHLLEHDPQSFPLVGIVQRYLVQTSSTPQQHIIKLIFPSSSIFVKQYCKT